MRKLLFTFLGLFVCLTITFAQSKGKEYKAIEFNVEQKDGIVQVIWSSSAHSANGFFTLERSQDGVNFSPFKGAFITAGRKKNIKYSEVDFRPYSVSYYRIKQTDEDGDYLYSMVKKVELDEEGFASVFPNPDKKDEIQVAISLDDMIGVDVMIMDLKGKEAYSIVLPGPTNDRPLSIDISEFDEGNYIVKVNTEDGRYAYSEQISITK